MSLHFSANKRILCIALSTALLLSAVLSTVIVYSDEIPYFIVSDILTIQTGVLNTGEVAISESHVTSYLISPSGAKIKTGEYIDHHTIPPGDALYVEIIWDSAGAEPGIYDMELEETCVFANGEGGELYNLQEDAFILYLEEPVYDFSLTNFVGLRARTDRGYRAIPKRTSTWGSQRPRGYLDSEQAANW